MATSPTGVAAFFDVDGTLLDTNVVLFYVHYKTAGMSRWRQWVWKAGFLRRVPGLLLVDKVSRAAFNRIFYRLYQGMNAETVKRLAAETTLTFALPRLYADAQQTIERHRSRGETVVLVTGAADFIVRPLAEHLGIEHIFAVELEEHEGVFTGNLTAEPLSDALKADAVRRFAGTHGIDLSQSYAYADSLADAAMLSAVGHPVAVNPSKRLLKLARQKEWDIVRWM